MASVHLVFNASIDDDATFNGEGDVLVPAGKAVADLLIRMLSNKGIQCTEAAQRDYYGWEFMVSCQEARVVAVLQCIDKWILTLSEHPSFVERLLHRSTSTIDDIGETIKNALESESDFTEVLIYSDADFPY